MQAAMPTHLINVSELPPDWCWLQRALPRPDLHWHHVTRQACAPWPHRLGGWVAAWRGVGLARRLQRAGQRVVLVAHGPRPAAYTVLAAALRGVVAPILGFSFNYTELPTGLRRRLGQWAFRRLHTAVTFSTMERALYARHFGMDPARILVQPWSVAPPTPVGPPLEAGDYVVAVGSQGRDYAVLARAMQQLPEVPLLLIAHPDNLHGLAFTPNVRVRTRVPLAEAENAIAHARFMVLPLAHAQVPCGHVTVVAAMQRAKALVATDSEGLHDYLRAGDNSLLCPPGDPSALAQAIRQLWQDPAQAARLGAAGQAFAQVHCTEAALAQWLADWIDRL